MTSFRFRTFYLSTLLVAGGLQLSCSSEGGAETEPVGSAQQAVSCTTAADCAGYGDSCDWYATCYKRSLFLPGFCKFVDKPDGSACDDGSLCTQSDTCQSGVCVGANPLPPQDACWDNTVDPNLPTTVYESTRFLWEGDVSIQSGVASGTIEENRAAVIRGQVTDRDGDLLTGVSITIVGHAEYGSTSSLETTVETDNGPQQQTWFDMVVNGGGELIVRYEKAGYLPVRRKIRVPWKDYVVVDAVKMTEEGSILVQKVKCNQSNWQAVQSTLPGAGTVRLLFPPLTNFNAVNGTNGTCADPNKEYNVRIVEYTTDDLDSEAMPGELPPTSAYTFAAELRLEDGSTVMSPHFNNAVIAYVDNFIGVKVGEQVPAGTYDGTIGAWTQSGNQGVAENGVVLNVNGSGQVETGGATLPYWTLSEQNLVTGWGNDKDYWRVPLWHFSSFDFNWPFKPPDGAEGPAELNPQVDGPRDDGSCTEGSIIICENQVLGERLPIAGTPIDLVYRSDRVPGYKAGSRLKIKLVDGTPPPGLHRIDVDVFVAGGVERHHEWDWVNHPEWTYEWQGKNAYGTKINGAQPVTVVLKYVYLGGVYTGGQGFGNVGDGVSIEADPVREEVIFSRRWKGTIGGWDASGLKLGGWSIDKLHAYSRDSQQLYRGDGSKRTAAAMAETIDVVPGASGFNDPYGIAVAHDGSIYVAEYTQGRIKKVSPSGTVSTIRENLSGPRYIALQPDGRLVFSESNGNRVSRCNADGSGVVETVDMDGMTLSSPYGVAVAPDGTLYVADRGHHRVLRRGSDGTVSVYAGTGVQSDDDSDDGELAKEATLNQPWGLALMPDGSLLITTYFGRVRRVDPSGYFHVFAGGGTVVTDGVLATQGRLDKPTAVAYVDGQVFIADETLHRIFRVSQDGRISTFAGDGEDNCAGNGGQATSASMTWPGSLAAHPDGGLLVADFDCNNVRRIGPTQLGSALPGGYVGVPSEDGSEMYIFDDAGRHRFTRDARTGEYRFAFLWGWSASGDYLLNAVYDARGTDTPKVTTIERFSDGNLYRFRSPFGKYTTAGLSAEKFLDTLTRPTVSGQSDSHYEMAYAPAGTGLLVNLLDPRENEHTFLYDDYGKLIDDRDPNTLSIQYAPFKHLERTPLASGKGYEVDVTTFSGLATTYQVDEEDDGDRNWTMTGPDGRAVSSVTKTDESSVTTHADGTIVSVTKAPDPRFGPSALIPSATVTLPISGNQLVVEQSRTVAGLTDPLTFDSIEEKVALKRAGAADLNYTKTLNRTTNTVVLNTPMSRATSATLDSNGRLATVDNNATGVVSLFYDTYGHISQIDQGTRRVKLAWDTSTGFIDSLWAGTKYDVQKYFVDLSVDARGQLGGITRNDGKQILFGYDASSNMTQLRRPNGAGFIDHNFTPNDVDLVSLYDAPDVSGSGGRTYYGWDKDRRLDSVTWPDQTGIDLVYHTGPTNKGKLYQLKTLEGDVLNDYGYGTSPGTNGRLTSIYSETEDITTSLDWDGPRLKSVATDWGGMSRFVSWSVGDYLRVAAESVEGGSSVAYGYDTSTPTCHALMVSTSPGN